MRLAPLCLATGVILVDQISKALTHAFLPVMNGYSYAYPYGGIGIFQNFLGVEFSISHATNRGAAWGAFAEFQIGLIILRILLIVGMTGYVLFYNKQRSWTYPFALIIAGAASNVADYFIYGHVVDMIHFVLWGYDFPVFNVADSAIFIGVVWLGVLTLMQSSSSSSVAKKF